MFNLWLRSVLFGYAQRCGVERCSVELLEVKFLPVRRLQSGRSNPVGLGDAGFGRVWRSRLWSGDARRSDVQCFPSVRSIQSEGSIGVKFCRVNSCWVGSCVVRWCRVQILRSRVKISPDEIASIPEIHWFWCYRVKSGTAWQSRVS
jgi:hypothetical protein